MRLKQIKFSSLRLLSKRLYRMFFALALLLISLMIGIIGYMYIEGHNFLDAFYMTVITVSTVGMNETRPLTETGRLFAALYIIVNFSLFAFSVSVLTQYLLEGELTEILKNYLTHRQTHRMQHHTIVCGYGRYGRKICEELDRSHKPFIVIERDKSKILQRHPDGRGIAYFEGDATSDDVLREAGISRAEALITALPDDAENVFVVLTARELHPNIKIIAKANNESTISRLYRAGANNVVMPDVVGGAQMANLVIRPEVVEFLDMLNGAGDQRLRLEEISFAQLHPELQHKSIRDMNIRQKTGVLILGYKNEEKSFVHNPTADTIFKEGDIIIVMGTEKQIAQFVNFCRQPNHKLPKH